MLVPAETGMWGRARTLNSGGEAILLCSRVPGTRVRCSTSEERAQRTCCRRAGVGLQVLESEEVAIERVLVAVDGQGGIDGGVLEGVGGAKLGGR